MIKVLIADDHAIVRRGLKEILREAPEEAIVGEARSGEEALELARADAWDVIILDITLPGRNGLETLKDLKLERPNLPVLMLSMHTGTQYVLGSLKAGAAGYLSKETIPDELIIAIQSVLRGDKYISRDLAMRMDPLH